MKSVCGEPLEPLGRLPARCTQWQWHPALHERVEVDGTTSGARGQVMAAKQKKMSGQYVIKSSGLREITETIKHPTVRAQLTA